MQLQGLPGIQSELKTNMNNLLRPNKINKLDTVVQAGHGGAGWAWWCMPLIQHLGGRDRRISTSPRPDSFTERIPEQGLERWPSS